MPPPDEKHFLEFWRLHEVLHFHYDTEEVDKFIDKDKELVTIIHHLGKVQKLLEEARTKGTIKDKKRILGEGAEGSKKTGAFEIVEKALKIEDEYYPISVEFKAMLYDELYMESDAFSQYIPAFGERNKQSGEINFSSPLMARTIELLAKGQSNTRDRLVDKYIVFINDFSKTTDPRELQNHKKEGNPKGENDKDEYELFYWALTPLILEYVNGIVKHPRGISKREKEIIDRLIDLFEGGFLVQPGTWENNPRIAAILYYLAGKIQMIRNNYAKAEEYYVKSLGYDDKNAEIYADKAIMPILEKVMSKDEPDGNEADAVFETAEGVIGEGRLKAGQEEEPLIKAARFLDKIRDQFKGYKDAAGLYRLGSYDVADERIGEIIGSITDKTPVPGFLLSLQKKTRSILRLRTKALGFEEKEDYQSAIQKCDEILARNPEDRETFLSKEECAGLLEQKKNLPEVTRIENGTSSPQEKEECKIIGRIKNNIDIAVRHLDHGDIGSAEERLDRAERLLGGVKGVSKRVADLKKSEIARLPALKERMSNLKARTGADRQGRPDDIARQDNKTQEAAADTRASIPQKESEIEKRKVYLSKKMCGIFENPSHPAARRYGLTLNAIGRMAQFERISRLGKTEKIDNNTWKLSHGQTRIFFVYIHNGNDVLVYHVGRKTNERLYDTVLRRFPKGYDFDSLLEHAKEVKDVMDARKGSLKAPASEQPDEAENMFIENLIVTAAAQGNVVERTGEVPVDAALNYINVHAPPIKEQDKKAQPGEIKLYTIDNLGEKYGIPRFEGAEKATELVYAYPVYDVTEGVLKIYVTQRHFEKNLKNNTAALAELIDHEYNEKVLGYLHRVAATRARYFIPDGSFISPFHEFYLYQITQEKNYSFVEKLNSKRQVSGDILDVFAGDSKTMSEIEKYEEKFFDFSRLLGLLHRAGTELTKPDNDINYDVIHGFALRAYKIRERWQRIRLRNGPKTSTEKSCLRGFVPGSS